MDESVNGDALSHIRAQLDSFRRSDAQRDQLIESIVEQYQILNKRFQDLSTDYENETASRRNWQNATGEARRDLQLFKQRTESNPFILALIDGDGAIFLEQYLKAGVEGGSEAAHKLHKEIREHVSTRHEGSSQWEIMVHIYANFEGLSRKLASIGIFKSPSELHSFARAFTFHHSLFNFIDVGSGKERADHKLKEMFALFVSNSHCKHIVFGGCHDAGYLPNLESRRRDEQVAARITLLETTPAQRDYHLLGLPITSFDTVFKNEPLPEFRVTTEPRPTAPSFEPQTPSSQLPLRNTPIAKAAAPSPSSSYASIGRHDPDVKEYSIAPSKSPVPRKFASYNNLEQRIDQPLEPKPDQFSMARLSQRVKQQKVCNNFHLGGHCRNGNACQYAHEPRLGLKEQQCLRARTRTTPCPNAPYCTEIDCYFGHECPDKNCEWADCKFGELHCLDSTIQSKHYENGDVEIVH